MKPRQHRSGFTLIELLVVVTILSILVALGSVGVKRALEASKDTKSASNLRQIGAGLNLYASENNGRYPIARGRHTYDEVVETDETTWPWQYQIREFIDPESDVYTSPNVPEMEHGYYLSVRAAFLEARAAKIKPPFAPVYQLKISQPTRHILAGEALYWAGAVDDADKDDARERPSFREDDQPGEKTPILFVAGNVEFFQQFDPNSMTASYEGLGSDYPASPPRPSGPPPGGPPSGGRPPPGGGPPSGGRPPSR
ncbi:MAG: type II secretion system protein [Verrucomicrobiota bacterium]